MQIFILLNNIQKINKINIPFAWIISSLNSLKLLFIFYLKIELLINNNSIFFIKKQKQKRFDPYLSFIKKDKLNLKVQK
jgi:tRNA isopentenyl-2-thiomethyl-A-37 hydroxylase MiaE